MAGGSATGERVQGDTVPALSSAAHNKDKSEVFYHPAGFVTSPVNHRHEPGFISVVALLLCFVFRSSCAPDGHHI